MKKYCLLFLLFVGTAFNLYAQPIHTDQIVLEVTITTTDAAYGDHDQINAIKTLTNAFDGSSLKGVVESVSVLDKESQKSALTLHFFDESPTVASSDNAALNITDAEMQDKWVGKVEIAAADYQDLSASAVATVNDIGLILGSKSADLFMMVESAGTPDYTAGTDLIIKIGLRRG